MSAQTEAERYQAIVAELRADLAGWPAEIGALTRPFFERLVEAKFSQVAALLPLWLSDLLKTSAAVSHKLGVAHLYGWWFYYAQDELIDGDAAPSVVLGAHIALLRMVEHYRSLGLDATPLWPEIIGLSLTSAASYASELETRFDSMADLDPAKLDLWTLDRILSRAAPFYFNTMAELHISGVLPSEPLYQSVLSALRCFTVARQISDDASDWLDDMKRGRLNYVSARLLARVHERGLVARLADIDLDWLAGYQARDEAFWTGIARTGRRLGGEALAHLAPYGESRFLAVMREEIRHHADCRAGERAARRAIRETFGLTSIEPDDPEPDEGDAAGPLA